MKLSGERLARDLAFLAEIGVDPTGGMTRLALTPADAQARAYVRDQMLLLGLAVTHDEVGNLFGRRAGRRADAPVVLTGSHLDTVPRGGRFDGPLGVVGALEAVRAIDEAGLVTELPLEVAVFVGEEGSRFSRGTIGSAALSGDVPVADILRLTDAGGTTFADALDTYGDVGAAIPGKRERGSVAAFVELHIEQGGVLESQRLDIGAVTAVAGLVQLVVRFTGDANHAGATPMELRKDALVGAAEMVLAVRDAARAIGGGAVATVGKLEVEPGGFNIIPGATTVSIDARAPRADLLDALAVALRGAVAKVTARNRLGVTLNQRQRVEPGLLDEKVIVAVERAAAAQGLTSTRMPSGAIHDALHLAGFAPSGMIFVPSIGGKSHCPEEDSGLSEMLRGCEVLAGALVELANPQGGS